jgi:predicted small lipoprotein YifL
MGSSARRVWLLVALVALAGCAKSGPSPEEQKAADEQRDRELEEEIERSVAPYQKTLEAFLAATSSGDFDAAYGMLAPTYTNMMPKEAFVERIKQNKNFQKRVEVKILRTQAQAGTTHARCVLGELGLAEIDFSTAGGTPKISSIKLGGMQALPGPG